MFVDDGSGEVEGRAFGKWEEDLDIVVRVLEAIIGPGQDGGESAATRIGSLDFWVVEADGERQRGCAGGHLGGETVEANEFRGFR